mmetsp:Transcript_107819/g.300598  ORF Transcript_107819/g.300598 Transcript_107819/m.300598 type:complete len:218 (+) Transcript_107819:133-786(+)
MMPLRPLGRAPLLHPRRLLRDLGQPLLVHGCGGARELPGLLAEDHGHVLFPRIVSACLHSLALTATLEFSGLPPEPCFTCVIEAPQAGHRPHPHFGGQTHGRASATLPTVGLRQLRTLPVAAPEELRGQRADDEGQAQAKGGSPGAPQSEGRGLAAHRSAGVPGRLVPVGEPCLPSNVEGVRGARIHTTRCVSATPSSYCPSAGRSPRSPRLGQPPL